MYYLNRGQNGGSLLKVTYAGGPTSLASGASGDGAHPRGWRMQVARQGRMPWPSGSGARSLEIMGLDGKITVVTPRRKAGEGTVTLPNAFRDGVFFVRSR
jgi:hypothetical protein